MAKIPLISIIIVHYKVFDELVACINSIIALKPKVKYEIIVVDNDEEKTIQTKLKERFPFVIYIWVKKNVGFGAGNNIGAKEAIGEYLFFLNPDTIILPGVLDILCDFAEKNKNAIVSPLLLNPQNKPYPLQGSAKLTPIRAIICLSILNKLFPKNPVAKAYWYMDWDKKSIKEVDVAPGTALFLKKEVFRAIGGFDERFFLFFEEDDLCTRLRLYGCHIFINPHAKVMHTWGASTKKSENTQKIFKKSRFLYFQKYYGTLWAHVVALFCR